MKIPGNSWSGSSIDISIDVFSIVRVLVCIELIAITWAFALVNLIEISLFTISLVHAPFRRELFKTICDIRSILVLVFLAWILIGMTHGLADFGSRWSELVSWRKLLLVPIILTVFKDQKDCWQALNVFLYTGIVYAILFFLVSIFTDLVYVFGERERLIENHATQSVWFSVCILILVSKILVNKGVTALNIVHTGLILVFFYCIISSVGRSGYLFLLVSTVTFALACASSTKWRLLSVSALVLFIGLALVTGSHSHERISAGIENFKNATTSENNTSLGIRRVMWTNTIKIISQYPLMGTGSGSFADAYAETVKDQTGWRAQNTDDPHQQYLHIWAEHGIIGLFIFLLLISAMASASKNRILLALSLSLLAGTALNSLFNGHFSAFVEGRLFWILSSAIAASSPSFLSPVYEYLIRKI